jgi:hypothetical protein
MIARLLVLSGCLTFTAIASAGDIYRWVDEKGQTHLSDTVPPQYQQRATKVDTSTSKVTEKARAEAADRAAKEKAALAGGTGTAAPTSGSGIGELKPENKPAASGIDDQRARCAQWRRDYEQNQDCFNQYRTVNGAIRSEAYQVCREVPDPAAECGAPTY